MQKHLPLPTSGNHVNTSMATIEKTCAANGAFNLGVCGKQFVANVFSLTECRAVTHNYVCFITNYESESVKRNGLRQSTY